MHPELTEEDRSHLKTLSICWYVYAGLALFGGVCGGLIVIPGVGMMMGGVAEHEDEMVMMGGLLMGAGIFSLLLNIPLAVLDYLAGKGLGECRRPVLIYVMSAIACLNIPVGLILAIFTFIVMSRPQVKAAFDAGGGAV